ncbi:hypothetical protein HMPREF1002_01413 [Porphyromonas sp. 31_2]|nr:hypothetical protein HMPREF1002_01413 [Porphyromonas sp. 31_2]
MSRLLVYLVTVIFLCYKKLLLSLNLFILFNYQILSLEC